MGICEQSCELNTENCRFVTREVRPRVARSGQPCLGVLNLQYFPLLQEYIGSPAELHTTDVHSNQPFNDVRLVL